MTPGVTQWAHSFGGTGIDTVRDAAFGTDGTSVIVGIFEGSITFGGASLASAGRQDGFVAKLDANGNHLWSKRLGGANTDSARAVAVDAAGNVYAIGNFQGAADFDGQQLTAVTPTDEYLIKLDATTGARAWAARLGPGLDTNRQALAVSGDGAVIVVAGAFMGSINLGGAALTSAGGMDAVIARYDANGAHVWSRSFGGTSNDFVERVVLSAGDPIVVGNYYGPADFGGGALPKYSPAGTNEVFVARYAATNGGHLWSAGYWGSMGSRVAALAVDAAAVYVGGQFAGAGTFGGPVLTSAGNADAMLAKYDLSTGAPIWAKRFGSASVESIRAVAVNGPEVWFAASFNGTVTVGTSTISTAGSTDVAYGSATTSGGDFGATGSVGGSGPEDPMAIGLSASHVWLGGNYSTTFSMFGASLPAVGAGDIFIGRTER